MDLVGDNPGPLAGLWNLDKGCWVVPLGRDTPNTDNDEIQSSIEARESSIYKKESILDSRERCSQKQRHFLMCCF